MTLPAPRWQGFSLPRPHLLRRCLVKAGRDPSKPDRTKHAAAAKFDPQAEAQKPKMDAATTKHAHKISDTTEPSAANNRKARLNNRAPNGGA